MPETLTSLTAPDLCEVARLPKLPLDSLQFLDISRSSISEIPGPLPSLTELRCDATPIQQLPVMDNYRGIGRGPDGPSIDGLQQCRPCWSPTG
jgi:hypothetical protein